MLKATRTISSAVVPLRTSEKKNKKYKKTKAHVRRIILRSSRGLEHLGSYRPLSFYATVLEAHTGPSGRVLQQSLQRLACFVQSYEDVSCDRVAQKKPIRIQQHQTTADDWPAGAPDGYGMLLHGV